MSDTALQAMRLHLVGCGKMGSALLKSWLDAGISPQNISARVATESSAAHLSSTYGIRASIAATYDGEDIVLLAVKPQMLNDVLSAGWDPAPTEPLYLSIAAGKTLDYFTRYLGDSHRVVRAMPNTPSLVGQGVATLVASSSASDKDKALASTLFSASGTAIWLESEAALDTATAVAGSGPAYIFHFAECLMRSAQALGLPEDTARQLVQGTLRGSVALADAENWQDLGQLRRDVTSKGGVTQAALDVLMPVMPTLIQQALEANIRRSKELG